MNKQILLKERKAISPIIATLLLLLIAIAAGVVVYAYVLGFMGNSINQNGTGQVAESLNIVAVSHNTTAILAYVENTGSNSITITGFYIYDTSGAVTYANSTVSVTITAGSTSLVAANNHTTPPPGAISVITEQVKVVTSNGNSAITALQKA